MEDRIIGTWSYRSFVNNPDLNLDFNSLRFGAGTLVLEEQESGQSSGSLGGTGWSLNLQGWSTMGKPMTVRFQGAGEIGGENWVYDFLRGLLLSNVAKWNKSNTSISWHNRSHCAAFEWSGTIRCCCLMVCSTIIKRLI